MATIKKKVVKKVAVKLIKKGYNVLVSTGSVPPQFVN